MYVQAYLDQFQSRMQDAYKKGSIEETQKELGQIMTDIYGGLGTVLQGASQAATDWDNMARSQGWDMDKLKQEQEQESRAATAKGFATMSQDSANELNGRFTTIQAHTFEINESVKAMAVVSSGIASSMDMLKNNTSAMLQHLAGIETNTARLESMQGDIRAMKSGIDDMNLKGIILKR
jgi:hypothetical protein